MLNLVEGEHQPCFAHRTGNEERVIALTGELGDRSYHASNQWADGAAVGPTLPCVRNYSLAGASWSEDQRNMSCRPISQLGT